MNKNEARALMWDVETALKQVAERHGLTVVVGGGSFTDVSFKPKVEFREAGAGAAEWRRLASWYSVDPAAYEKVITVNGRRLKLVGINTRAPRFPFIGEDPTGSKFKLTVDAVTRGLEREARVEAEMEVD